MHIESALKTAISHVISSKGDNGHKEESYLDTGIFEDDSSEITLKKRLDNQSFLDDLKSIIEESDKKYIKHNKKEYNNVPFWVLCNEMYFSQAIAVSSNSKNVNFITISDDLLEYTYIEDGKMYKNVDVFSEDSLNVSTTKYEISGNSEKIVNTLDYKISLDANTNKTYSGSSKKSPTVNLNNLIEASSSWRYQRSYSGNTKIRTMAIGAIAAALASMISTATGLPWTTKFLVVAATYIFDKNLRVIYFKVDEYIDDSFKLRPKFKDILRLYEDEAHTKYIRTEVRIFDAVM